MKAVSFYHGGDALYVPDGLAGIWHDAIHRRQYGLFIDIRQQDSSDQVAGQISCVGAQNGGQKYNCEAAIGSTRISSGWHFLACTFGRAESGGNEARVYIDGRLDQRPGLNPSSWSGGIANGGAGGADFTVAAVHRAGEVGEWFVGAIGGVAVCNRGERAGHRSRTRPGPDAGCAMRPRRT